jgi:MFS family permease
MYLTLSSFIAIELDAAAITIWMFTALIVAMGALAPFVGPLADLFGRKIFFLAGLVFSILGSIICAVTPNAAGFITGQVFLGFGAVVQELMAIAIVAEIVPTEKRPMYSAMILCTFIPWAPATLYANWMTDASWRWIGCALAIWNVLTFVLIAWFYRPPPRVNALGLSRGELFKRVDFVGGLLIICGLVFVLVGLNTGGQNKPWKSAYVISFLVLGFSLMIIFGLWEAFGAKWPLFPRRIIYAPRPFWCLLWVIFAAGINYVPLVIFWPIESVAVFDADRHQTGINTLPLGLCILGGAIVSALLIGFFPKRVTIVMTVFCIVQTIGKPIIVTMMLQFTYLANFCGTEANRSTYRIRMSCYREPP